MKSLSAFDFEESLAINSPFFVLIFQIQIQRMFPVFFTILLIYDIFMFNLGSKLIVLVLSVWIYSLFSCLSFHLQYISVVSCLWQVSPMIVSRHDLDFFIYKLFIFRSNKVEKASLITLKISIEPNEIEFINISICNKLHTYINSKLNTFVLPK